MYKWQYNGADKWDVIVGWCKQHIPGQWAASHETIHFATEEAFSYFLLRWI